MRSKDYKLHNLTLFLSMAFFVVVMFFFFFFFEIALAFFLLLFKRDNEKM